MKDTAWFGEAKFGIFMHYGLYSQMERGEWAMYQEKIPCADIAALAETFDPSGFDAERLVRQAKEAGAGYMVLTSRHHEGFCLFDSKVSDFGSVPLCGRDLVREFVEACRKVGLRVGIYYSLLDWRFRGYHDRERYGESFRAMVDQTHAQVRELLTNYGKIDYLWFDGGWFPDLMPNDEDYEKRIAALWRADELMETIRSLQPDVLLNDRTGLPGDVLTPEQCTKESADARYSEACMTIGDRWGWGYIRHNPNRKSMRNILQHMMIQASFGGNFLLNLGLCPNGETRDTEEELLAELGQWLRFNGESLYGTTPADKRIYSIIGEVTQKDNLLYFHVFRWPHRGEAVLSGLYRRVLSAELLENGQTLTATQEANGRLVLRGLPALPPDTRDTVIKITLSDENAKEAADEPYGIL